jgi:hypothetical protein
MAFDAHVLQVLIASPSDTKEARDETEKALHGWNSARAVREQVILLPRRWESDSVPRMGSGDGQEVINAQLVDSSDIVIVIFNSKIGQATPRAISGTAEELERAVDQGKHVHVFFSDAPVPRDALESAKEVEEFKKSLEAKGLYGSFSDAADLAYQVRNAIEADLQLMDLAAPTGRNAGQRGADPIASYEFHREQDVDNRGKIRYKTRNTRLEVTNHGEAAADNFTFTLTPVDGGELPMLERNTTGVTIPARGMFAYPLIQLGGSASVLTMEMAWEEHGKPKTKTQTVSL